MLNHNTPVIIRFSPTELQLGRQKATSLGLSLNKWLKYLVTREIETISKFGTARNEQGEYPKQKTTQEMIDEDHRMIEKLVEDARNSPYDPDLELPY